MSIGVSGPVVGGRGAERGMRISDCGLRIEEFGSRGLADGHSESLKHRTAMQALFVAWYNFARKLETVRNDARITSVCHTYHSATPKVFHSTAQGKGAGNQISFVRQRRSTCLAVRRAY